jgi:D-alanine-D-alanine ligase-like ATP-grasp enzyme
MSPERLALALAGRGGGAVRGWASRLDVIRSVGLRYALQWRKRQARAWELGDQAVESLYKQVWREAAEELGAEATELEGEFIEMRRGAVTTRVWRQMTALDDPVALKLALDKTGVHKLLAARGIAVPEYIEFGHTDLAPALRFMADAGGPCVVKPAGGGRGGAAVTGCVSSEVQLARAVLSATRLGSRVLIERRIPGDMYRLLFLDGELLDVVVRYAPHVTGDGRSTILELLTNENERRFESGRAQSPLTVDLDLVFTLAAAGRTPFTVLGAGERVQVKSASSENAQEENHTVRDYSPEVVEESAEAVRAVGLRLSGVDVVTPDIGRSLADAGGAIIEVNGTPGFQYHYVVADPGSATRVAVPVLERVFETVGAKTV